MFALIVAICGFGAAACGGGSNAGCSNPIREPLDPESGTHVLDSSTVKYKTDPPTSGPHPFRAPPSGLLTRTLTPGEQVALLEAMNVIVQYRDDALRPQLEKLAVQGDVTVAPNPGLSKPIVLTAWTYKLNCETIDMTAIQNFIKSH